MQTKLASKQSTPIVLSTLNARYIHSAFGLRYLKANLQHLESSCEIEEFTLDVRPEDAVEALLAYQPEIIGFGVYIWNIKQTTEVVSVLKAVAPHIKIVLGGPEVSYEQEGQRIVELADYVITGWGDISFRTLAEQLLNDEHPEQKIQAGEQPKLDQIRMPYHLYSDHDIQRRVMYVEASRGCPFKCEFCLSALDKTAWPFDADQFLAQMDDLYQRGARHFKFVDRTFNLKVSTSNRILDFFLERMDDDLFLHFEVIPDHLPEALKEKIKLFPVNSLQFEIGIQTFNPEVQTRISRRQKNDKAEENIRWICENTNAHVHADLIAGLPGESLESFAESFDRLFAIKPHEIQVGILKRLRGSPIIRHAKEFQLAFNPNPPYTILSNSELSYQDLQNLNRFARYWDLIGNSGRFKHSLNLMINQQPFQQFDLLAKAIFEKTGQTHKIALLRLFDLVFEVAVEELKTDPTSLAEALEKDFFASGLKSLPRFMNHQQQNQSVRSAKRKHNARQSRH